ncbi:SDR family NAD(P)-dependent oxidoreductase [Arthrobacter sp. 18067]|uniref:SDR family NAD(P)-dependent oxidoreductase n=1 Tax=Arthrobacter sp. 18067 TaxID=2681413 RepID=UPI001357E4A9|nr:SDR family NAD(P)-dependent oxidoreductase [Arthrobacter sp. 18067]
MANQLDGQIAVITGGAGGLGSTTAIELAREGAGVVIVDINQSRLDATADRIRDEVPGAQVDSRVVDVTDSASVEDAFGGIAGAHGRLDILVTAHGFPRDARLLSMSDQEWSDVIAVCLTGTFVPIRAAARHMVEHSYGRIVTVASRAWHGNPGQANYSAAKAGVVGLTKSVAKELGRSGITANAIAPGLVQTESLRGLERFEQIAERAIRDNSVKRLGEPGDVAAAIRFLVSPDAGFITGEVVHVSGGRFG